MNKVYGFIFLIALLIGGFFVVEAEDGKTIVIKELFKKVDLSKHDPKIDSVLDSKHVSSKELELLKAQAMLEALEENAYNISSAEELIPATQISVAEVNEANQVVVPEKTPQTAEVEEVPAIAEVVKAPEPKKEELKIVEIPAPEKEVVKVAETPAAKKEVIIAEKQSFEKRLKDVKIEDRLKKEFTSFASTLKALVSKVTKGFDEFQSSDEVKKFQKDAEKSATEMGTQMDNAVQDFVKSDQFKELQNAAAGIFKELNKAISGKEPDRKK